jgi:hypothetical protein
LGIFDLFKGGQGGKGGLEPAIQKDTRTYVQMMDEITTWNIDRTDILEVLRREIEEERLATWSRALEGGIRKGVGSYARDIEESPLFPVYSDLYRFVKGLRPKLLKNPTMKNAKGIEKLDSISVCIICGIRALQKERGVEHLITTFQWKLLERYLGGLKVLTLLDIKID